MERTLEHFRQDIIKACDKITKYIAEHTFDSFSVDTKTFDAVMMEFIVIGEAATHFPVEIRERNPEIRWTSVVGLRNFLTHEYFEIDPKKIWNTATVNIPELKIQMESIQLN